MKLPTGDRPSHQRLRPQAELPDTARGSAPRRPLSFAHECDGGDPAKLWAFYLQLVEVEQAFKELKGDLAIRPIYHQTRCAASKPTSLSRSSPTACRSP